MPNMPAGLIRVVFLEDERGIAELHEGRTREPRDPGDRSGGHGRGDGCPGGSGSPGRRRRQRRASSMRWPSICPPRCRPPAHRSSGGRATKGGIGRRRFGPVVPALSASGRAWISSFPPSGVRLPARRPGLRTISRRGAMRRKRRQAANARSWQALPRGARTRRSPTTSGSRSAGSRATCAACTTGIQRRTGPSCSTWPSDPAGSEVDPTWAEAPARDLTYEVDGQTRTSVIPLGILLCETTCPPEAATLYQP